MVGTPKLQRKASLSLTTRLNQKRHSASPQNRMKTSTSNGEAVQRSPSVISICSDGGIECTPPHKKIMMNLDDSLDYSPKVFDSSFSPTCLLSQTLAIDSPEVGWKWSRHSNGDKGRNGVCGFEDNSSTRTPDSAYAADSSFASAGSSSTELMVNVRTRSDRLTYDSRREDQRKILEQELRRVEKTRAEEKLKQRCAKLQEQLKSAGTQKSNSSTSQNMVIEEEGSSCSNNDIILSISTSMDVEMRTQTSLPATTTASTLTMVTPEKPKKQETLNDFFNDSDSDCFLLAATQEIESKIDVKTQPVFVTNSPTNPTSINYLNNGRTIQHANSAPVVATTPTSSSSSNKNDSKEKRSSFYMKFLEDDCPDDWFVSLDDAIIQATQAKKPRTSLQRYKSMPTASATVTTNTASVASTSQSKINNNANSILNAKTKASSAAGNAIDYNAASSSSSNLSRMKRHSSTHSLSPASSHYRGRQLQLNK